MAENNINGTATPNQAPAPSMTANAAGSIQKIDPATVVELNLFGKVHKVPFGEAQAMLQEGLAGREALKQARELRASVHLDREHAERWRTLEHNLKTNPTGALEGMRNLARSMGAQVDDDAFAGAAPAMNTAPQGNLSASAPDRDTSDLNRRLAAIESTQHQRQLTERVGTILDRYPAFIEKPGLRSLAERQILAAMVVDPNTDPEEVARAVHTELYDSAVVSPANTQVRDARLGARQVPHVSPNIGSGSLQEGLQPATGASLKGSQWRDDTAAFLRRAQNAVLGPNPPGA